MKCAICLADNVPGAVFCSDCGTMLTPSTTLPSGSSGSSGSSNPSTATTPSYSTPPSYGASPSFGASAGGGRPSNRALVVTSAIAIVASLALAALLVVLALDDSGDRTVFDQSGAAATTVAPSPATLAPAEIVARATAGWNGRSAAFLQPHTDAPFTSGGRLWAIASVDDLATRKNEAGTIDGLVLLGWNGSDWVPADGLPFTSPTADVTFEVLGDRLVDAPMVTVTWCCDGARASTRVFRILDGVPTDPVSGRPIDDEWTTVELTDRSFDFLEYTTCSSGEVIEIADGTETFFCDVETRSRLEIADDGTTSITSEDVTNPRPVVVYEGDLGVPGVTMTRPECDGSYVTAVGASISSSERRNRWNVARLLKRYPGSHYLLNGSTCDSLWPSVGDAPVYMVYFGPFDTKAEACAARKKGPRDSYVRPLSDDISHRTKIYC